MKFKKYKLKDLVENFSVRARDYGGSEGLEFLGVSNDDGIVKSKSAAEHKGEEYKIIEKGCFAYNPYRINIGSIAYHNEDIKGLISPAYVIFKTKPNSIKDNLLFKFLKSAEGLRQIRFHGRGTVRQALRFEDLCKIEISLPSYEEQESLISNIEKTEFESNLISSELTHQLDLIKQLRQAFLREAMQGKLVDGSKLMVDGLETGHDLLAKIKTEKAKLIAEKKIKQGKLQEAEVLEGLHFEIPKHWVWCNLDDICRNITDGTHQTPIYTNEGIPFISAQHVKPFKFTPDNRKFVSYEAYLECIKNKKPEIGDILITRVGAIGEAAVINQEIDFAFYVSLGLIQPFINLVNSHYIELVINSPYGNAYSKGNVSSKGSSAGNFNLGRIRSFQIPLPPLHEQAQIVAKLEELMAFCDGLEQSIKESQGYNEKLLQQVLREALQSN